MIQPDGSFISEEEVDFSQVFKSDKIFRFKINFKKDFVMINILALRDGKIQIFG